LNIDKDYLEKQVRDVALAGMMEILNKGDMVEKIVREITCVHLDDRGRICSAGSYDDKGTLLETIVTSAIQAETKAAIKELVDEHREEIRSSIKSELLKKKNRENIADAFINTVSRSFGEYFKPVVDIKFIKPE